jgi:predicted RecA/RadA family phage recombinase
MKNYVNEGKTITVTAAADILSGKGVLMGALFGVAQKDALSGDSLPLLRVGHVTLAKVSAQAWTEGAKVYWDNATKLVTTTASGNTLIGCATAVAANPSDTGTLVLDGAVR